MAEKLTKRQALEICRDLWTWMRDEEKTSDGDKSNWFGWEEIGTFDNDCPCCEYDCQCDPMASYDLIIDLCDCLGRCLLREIWPMGCCELGSPYRPFHDGNGTPADAQRIIDGCNAELEKMGDSDE